MPRCKKGNTFPNEDWHDCDDELINRSLVQERPDDFAPAHHPDVLANLCPETFGEGADRLGDELDTRRYGSRPRSPREHIAHVICVEARAHPQTSVESLAAEDLGIGGELEFRQAVEALSGWPWRARWRREIRSSKNHPFRAIKMQVLDRPD